MTLIDQNLEADNFVVYKVFFLTCLALLLLQKVVTAEAPAAPVVAAARLGDSASSSGRHARQARPKAQVNEQGPLGTHLAQAPLGIHLKTR